LARQPTYEGEEEVPAFFEVLDLTTDPRWMHKKFIATEPHFKYFCGVPIRTDNNVNIGCLFLMDTEIPEIRESISTQHAKLLASCARNIMIHLQFVREAQEKKRAVAMNMCMADFISPKDRFRRQAHLRSPQAVHLPNGHGAEEQRPDGDVSPTEVPATPPHEDMERRRKETADLEDTTGGRGRDFNRKAQTSSPAGSSHASLSPPERIYTEADHQSTFDRAVMLIRQSLDLDLGGGVVMLDTSASAAANTPMSDFIYAEETQGLRGAFSGRSRTPSNDSVLFSHVSTSKPEVPTPASPRHPRMIRERVVLAAASISRQSEPTVTYGRADPTFSVAITPPELLKMCQKHPRGKLYSLPDNLPESLYDAEGNTLSAVMSAKQWYQVLLRRQFPEARQVIFVPMFQASTNRWTACFAYTSSPYRIFSYDQDYLHTLSFCNAIRAELVKLAVMFANQQKTDFVGEPPACMVTSADSLLSRLALSRMSCAVLYMVSLRRLNSCKTQGARHFRSPASRLHTLVLARFLILVSCFVSVFDNLH
jgi:hypothetical protein